jgi:hypothetical protein
VQDEGGVLDVHGRRGRPTRVLGQRADGVRRQHLPGQRVSDRSQFASVLFEQVPANLSSRRLGVLAKQHPLHRDDGSGPRQAGEVPHQVPADAAQRRGLGRQG